jgi:hypothetical protein
MKSLRMDETRPSLLDTKAFAPRRSMGIDLWNSVSSVVKRGIRVKSFTP